MLRLTLRWMRRRETEANAAREALAALGRLEGRRAIAREQAAQVRAARGMRVVRTTTSGRG